MLKRTIGFLSVISFLICNVSIYSEQWDLSEMNGEYTGDSFLMTWTPGVYLDNNNIKLGFEIASGYTWGEGLNDPFYQAILGAGGVYLQVEEAFRVTLRGGNFASPMRFLYGTWAGGENILTYNTGTFQVKNLFFIGSMNLPDYGNPLISIADHFSGKLYLWETIKHSFAINLKGDFYQNIEDISDNAYGVEFALPLILFDRTAGTLIPEITIVPRLGIMGRSGSNPANSSEVMNYNVSNIFSLPRDKSGDFLSNSGDLFISINSGLRFYPFNNRTLPVLEWLFLTAFGDVGWIYTSGNEWIFNTTIGGGLGFSLFGFFDFGIDITYNPTIGVGYLIGIGFVK